MVQAETRAPLTRQRVLQTALRYVDDNGLAALSMHKLGAELGVKGMSLYRHVDGKDGLLDGIVEAMWAEIDPPPQPGTDWGDNLRALARSLRALVHRHPNAAPLLMGRQVMPTPALEVFDHYLHNLQAGGLTQQQAVELIRTVTAYGFGFALAELTWMDLAGEDEDDLGRMRRLANVIPTDASDRLARTALLLCSDCDMAAQFDLGIDLMIRGTQTPS